GDSSRPRRVGGGPAGSALRRRLLLSRAARAGRVRPGHPRRGDDDRDQRGSPLRGRGGAVPRARQRRRARRSGGRSRGAARLGAGVRRGVCLRTRRRGDSRVVVARPRADGPSRAGARPLRERGAGHADRRGRGRRGAAGRRRASRAAAGLARSRRGDAALRPRPGGQRSDLRSGAARALRGRGRPRGRAYPCRRAREGRARAGGPRARAARPRPGGALRWPAHGVSELLLLPGRNAGADLHRRESRAARTPRGRAGPDRRSRRHDPAQRRPVGRPPPRRAAPLERQEPLRAVDRHAADRAAPRAGQRLGHARRRAGARQGPERAAPGHPDPGPAGRAAVDARAGGPVASHAGRGRRALAAGAGAHPRARGPRPRLVRGPGRVDGPRGGRRAVRGAALRAATRESGAPLRGRRHRARLRPGRGAGGDRGQARGAASAAEL
ncbi:MAG: Isochorismate synthase @ Menaquinone-specific isochorismate synthase, partial [uncultured Solirubrobacterales bacterium]